MIKIHKLFMYAVLLLISFSFVHALGGSYMRYALQRYNVGLDSLNLRSSMWDGVNEHTLSFNDTSLPIHKCVYGNGDRFGAYPLKEGSPSQENAYASLLIPTTSSLRIIDVNCSLIDSISLDGTLVSVPAIIPRTDDPFHYLTVVVAVRDTTTNHLFLRAYSLNSTRKFNLIRDIDLETLTNLTLSDNIYGVACGKEDKLTVQDFFNSQCGIYDTSNNKLISVWINNASLSFVTQTTYDHFYNGHPAQLFVVDYDSDDLNDFIIASITGNSGHNDMSFRYSNIQFDGTLKEEKYASLPDQNTNPYTNSYFPLVDVVQIGGIDSHYEFAFYYNFYNTYADPKIRSVFGIVWDDFSVTSYNGGNVKYIKPFTIKRNNLNELCFINPVDNKRYCYDYNKQQTMTPIALKSSYSGVNLQTFAMPDYMSSVDQDDSFIYLSNGKRYSIYNPDIVEETFDPLLNNASTGYLVAGDINYDYRPELIYIDSGQTIIYTQNATPLAITPDTTSTTSTTTTSTSSTTSSTTTTSSGETTTTQQTTTTVAGEVQLVHETHSDVGFDVQNSGLLPEIYYGVTEFFKPIIVPFVAILIPIMFVMLMFLILGKIKGT